MEPQRCTWAKTESEIAYHDHEWCKPLHDERKLFEMLILEGMQAGLSWRTILNKREHMRLAFDDFDPQIISRYGDDKKAELLLNSGIIRNRAKINALIGNAVAFLKVQEEYGSFDRYIWDFTGGTPIVNAWKELSEMPATSEISDRISADLYKKGFRFVGSTICYSYMQAIGMVNDHMTWCPEYGKC